MASQPHVGIFWVFKGRLFKSSCPVKDGVAYADVINGQHDHVDYWLVLQEQNPELGPYEYENVPRGRVMFFKRRKQFRVLMDKRLHTPRIKQSLLREFSLPKSQTVFGLDPHYTTDPEELERMFGGD